MHSICLQGCRPSPLAHYLKALGLLRVVAEQKDADLKGFWQDNSFVLETHLSQEELHEFLLREYRPSPLMSPWNGGSGFYPKDKQDAILALESSKASRLQPLRSAIASARGLLRRLGVTEKVSLEEKSRLLEACRGCLPELSVRWLDAAFVLSEEGPKSPPLLGSGGNDGRLEFSQHYMQRLLCLFDPETGAPAIKAPMQLMNCLYDTPTDTLLRGGKIGQFFPGAAGGINGTAGFEANSLSNPWDYVLMLEGAVLFASAATRRMHHQKPGASGFPFTVHLSGLGYGSNASQDEQDARAEIWLPLWAKPASHLEIAALLGQGHAYVGGRTAQNGVDFARAVASSGVAQGIDAFERIGLQKRNGLAFFAIPQGRFVVQPQPQVRLLCEVDLWLGQFRRAATSSQAPLGVRRALRQIEEAVLALSQFQGSQPVLRVLVELGRCQRVLGQYLTWSKKVYLPPVPLLSSAWLKEVCDASVELRLAVALASSGISLPMNSGQAQRMWLRQMLDPVELVTKAQKKRVQWRKEFDRDLAWSDGPLVDVLNRVFYRQLVRLRRQSSPCYLSYSSIKSDSSDISLFLEGQLDEKKLADLLWGCLLLDSSQLCSSLLPNPPEAARPDALYTILKLCFPGAPILDCDITIDRSIYRLLLEGDVVQATRKAARKLRGSGLPLLFHQIYHKGIEASRVSASLLFPIEPSRLEFLAWSLLGRETA